MPTYRNHFAFGGHVRRSVGQTQLCLQRVEVGFQFGLLFNARRLVLAAVLPVLVQFLLHAGQRIVSLTRLEPRQGPLDPFQQLNRERTRERGERLFEIRWAVKYTNLVTYVAGQTLVFFHEALILLVNLEHFADAISCGFRLLNNKRIK